MKAFTKRNVGKTVLLVFVGLMLSVSGAFFPEHLQQKSSPDQLRRQQDAAAFLQRG